MTIKIPEKKTIRLDLYLFYIRIFKSRNIATKFIMNSRLRVSGQLTQKPHKQIAIGQVLTFSINNQVRVLEVINIPNRRGPFLESLNFYNDLTPVKKTNNDISTVPIPKFVHRVGRPTKLERRQTDKLMRRY